MPRYDFDQGLPDPSLYPISTLARHYSEILEHDGPDTLNYFGGVHAQDMAYGHHGLREAVADWLTQHEGCGLASQSEFEADNVLLANGSTNGIAMVVNTFLGSGDAMIAEEVSYPYAAKFAVAAGAEVFTVPVDDNGMRVDLLADVAQQIASRGLRLRLIYTISTFQAPTGTVLPEDRRRALIQFAQQNEALILDDNCYYHLWYDEAPPPSLLSLEGAESVIQSGSFSKYLAPGLRMAWLAGVRNVIGSIAAARQDFAVSQLTARVVERFVREGQFDEHLDTLRDAYRTKRDTAARALAAHGAGHVEFVAPKGGIYFWLKLDENLDYDRFVATAAELGVGFRDGARFVKSSHSGKFLRLSVAQTPQNDIEPGIQLLAQALKEAAS